MGFREWFFPRDDDEEYSSSTGSYSASTKRRAPDSDPQFSSQSSFRSSVTRCEPDETGQIRCRRYVTTRQRGGPDNHWSEERRDEEIPYEEMGQSMDPMMDHMNKMMEEMASAFSGFGSFWRHMGHAQDGEEEWGQRQFPRGPQGFPGRYQAPGADDDDVFDG